MANEYRTGCEKVQLRYYLSQYSSTDVWTWWKYNLGSLYIFQLVFRIAGLDVCVAEIKVIGKHHFYILYKT